MSSRSQRDDLDRIGPAADAERPNSVELDRSPMPVEPRLSPDRQTATKVHREAHGREAYTLHEVKQVA